MSSKAELWELFTQVLQIQLASESCINRLASSSKCSSASNFILSLCSFLQLDPFSKECFVLNFQLLYCRQVQLVQLSILVFFRDASSSTSISASKIRLRLYSGHWKNQRHGTEWKCFWELDLRRKWEAACCSKRILCFVFWFHLKHGNPVCRCLIHWPYRPDSHMRGRDKIEEK